MEESVGTAVDDRRHGEVIHLAKAISVRDLHDQVQAKMPRWNPHRKCVLDFVQMCKKIFNMALMSSSVWFTQ